MRRARPVNPIEYRESLKANYIQGLQIDLEYSTILWVATRCQPWKYLVLSFSCVTLLSVTLRSLLSLYSLESLLRSVGSSSFNSAVYLVRPFIRTILHALKRQRATIRTSTHSTFTTTCLENITV